MPLQDLMHSKHYIYRVAVRDEADRFWSLSTAINPFAVWTRLGEWCEARAGGLLGFDSYTAALEFAKGAGTILWCEAEGPLPLPQHALALEDSLRAWTQRFSPCDHYEAMEQIIRLAWDPEHNESCEFLKRDAWPRGTVAYRRIKPIAVCDTGTSRDHVGRT